RGEYARRPVSAEKPLLIEFVSANPNGPLHVGHGRGAALGDSLARIFRHLGYAVSTEYYVNDVGNQMRNLGVSVMWRILELRPDYLTAEERATVEGWNKEELYKGDYVYDIALAVTGRYPKTVSRPEGIDFFRQRGIEHTLEMIRTELERFGVSMDEWFSEGRLYEQNLVDKSLDTLRRRGFLKEEAGALWFLSTKFGDDKDRVIKRKDERPTYFASDIAYHAHKFERGFGRLIDIWGTDHHGYVRRVKAAVEAMGNNPDDLTILLYQLVSLVRGGKPVAMSTRAGEFVTLREVLDEVGKDACRFFFAMRSPDSQLEFDLDLAKKQAPENPVFYVQYVHARCCSIFRESEKRGFFVEDTSRFAPPEELAAEERGLLVRLVSYPDVVEQCRRDMSPHHLTTYLLALAGDFHRFYENCRVLDESRKVMLFRLALTDAVRVIIRSGLSLLGVGAPETM
ncbi:MAG TPA: arginine--tRNA ligase, partial [Elusimicrobiota bacterium]|nr:arginine--tRNA ligase [Elusimicrobiota bacterium]